MRLIAYRTSTTPVVIRPASPRRTWMDETRNRFAYRCLPLTMGSQYGWELLCPCTFEACWHGRCSTKAITIVRLGSGTAILPESHFGDGILTFHPCHLFRTEAPYNLFVTGPTNVRKDGIVPMTAVVETDWLPFTFSMNWMFTRPGVTVRFEEGEPFCQFFPVDRDLLEQVEPEVHDIGSNPELMTQYEEWTASRNAFNEELKVPGSEADAKKWQQFYNRGTLHTGEKAATRHRTRLNLRPFVGAEGKRADDTGGNGAQAPAQAQPPREVMVGAESVLMKHPAAVLEETEDQSIVLYNPTSGNRLRISQPLYRLVDQLSQPRPLREVLPDEPLRQERTLGYLRLLASKGFLVPPDAGISPVDVEDSGGDTAPLRCPFASITPPPVLACGAGGSP